MKTKGLNPAAYLRQTQKLVSQTSAEVLVKLPQTLGDILREEMYRKWAGPDGAPFRSFADFAKAQQPWGLGLGQHRQWASPFMVYHICDGFSDVQSALRPIVVEKLPAAAGHGGDRKSKGRDQADNISLNGHGTGEEYLLRRLKRHDQAHGTDYAGGWARGKYVSVRGAAIAAGILKPKPKRRRPSNKCAKYASPTYGVRVYWNRATKAQRKRIAAMIRKASRAAFGRISGRSPGSEIPRS
jgi:hypothetical protein